jgi:addiction module HigA family antidote
MKQNNTKEPVCPGKILQDNYLKPKKITQKQLSQTTGILKRHISEILSGRRAIGPDTAVRLSKGLNTDPEYWINLQKEYDIDIARKTLAGIIPEDQPLEKVLVNNPHDKLIKIVFSDRTEAEAYFKQNLPPKLVEQIDWDTLKLEGTQYIDDELKESASDLLFSVCFKNNKDLCYLYILFEHQTTPDKWIRFRVYKYKARIWDESLKNEKNKECLNPILAMVVYIGNSSWNYSTEFSDLIGETPLLRDYIPRFKHFLMDHSDKDEKIKGAIKAQIAHLLIQASFQQQLKDIETHLCELMMQLPQEPGINYVRAFSVYIYATQRRDVAVQFFSVLKQHPQQKGGDDMLCAVDEWRLEGKREGKREGKMENSISIISNMKNMGIDWGIISKATGVDQDQYQQMQREYQQLVAQPSLSLEAH